MCHAGPEGDGAGAGDEQQPQRGPLPHTEEGAAAGHTGLPAADWTIVTRTELRISDDVGCISPWVQLIFGRSGERPTEQSARLSEPQRGELHGLSGWPPRGWSPSGSPSPGFVRSKVCLLEKGSPVNRQ